MRSKVEDRLPSRISLLAQSPNELSQFGTFLRPGAMAIIPVPLTLRRAATSTMHPANPPTSYRGRATALATAAHHQGKREGYGGAEGSVHL